MSSKDIDLLRLCVAFPHIRKINDSLNVHSFLRFIKWIHTVKQNDIFEVLWTKVTGNIAKHVSLIQQMIQNINFPIVRIDLGIIESCWKNDEWMNITWVILWNTL